MTSLLFFRFMISLERFGSQIPHAWSVTLKFSLTVTFYLTKTENRTKKSLTYLSHYCFEWRYYFCQKMLIFCKKMMTSAKLRKPWYWKVYFLKLHIIIIIIIIVINLFSVDQINRIHNHSIYVKTYYISMVKTIAIIEDKC